MQETFGKKQIAKIFAYLAIITLIFITAFALSFSFGENFASAEGSPVYSNQINVKKENGGYFYGNGENYLFSQTLQGVLDSISENADKEITLRLYFDNVETEESLSLANRDYVFSGILTNVNTNYNIPFITVFSGRLQMVGLVLRTNVSAVNVEQDASFTLDGSQILVQMDSKSYSGYALNVNGEANILQGKIEFESKYTSGVAVSGSSPLSRITIGKGGKDVIISGNSACVFNSGIADIYGGVFNATYPTYTTATQEGNTLSGYAILISSDGVVNVNGGKFTSVTPENTVVLSGNPNSMLAFNGGEICGQLSIYAKNNSSSLLIGNSRVSSTDGVGALLKSNEEIMTPQNAVLTTYNANGYKFISWLTAQGNVSEKEIPISNLPEGDIQILATNVYEVTFKIGKATRIVEFAYGEKVKLADYFPSIPNGFEIGKILKDNVEIENDEFIVTGANTIFAELTLKKPILGHIEGLSQVYDGNVILFSVDASHEIATLSVQWEKYDLSTNGYLLVSTDENLRLQNVADSGLYRCLVRASYDDYSSELYSNEFLVQIEKGRYEDVPKVSLSGIYGKDKTLEFYELPSGFSWTDDSVVPCVAISEYDAIYCLDTDNYQEEIVKIQLRISKGQVSDDYTVYPHSGFSGVYSPDKTLADYALDEKYYWLEPDCVPTCEVTYYEAYYNPDKGNYENYQMWVIVNLTKASYENIENVYLQCDYTEGLNLSCFKDSLPQGYSFVTRYPILINLTVGEQEFDLIYNFDSQNYEDFNEAKLILYINKGTPIFSGRYPFYGVYAPNSKLSDYTFEEYEGLRWSEENTELKLGENEYDAIYNPDSLLYNDLLVKVKVVTEKQIADGYEEDYSVEVVYKKDLTLGDLSLKAGYRFSDETIKVYVGSEQTFEAIFNPDANYYLDASVFIKVTVKKAIINLGTFEFSDLTVVYDGNEHSVIYAGTLPESLELVKYVNNGHTKAGKYAVVCVLRQTDLVNYEPIKLEYEAVLTIEKAVSEIQGNSLQTFVQDGTQKKAYVTLNNKEQSLKSDIENKFVKTGSYRIVFRAEESENYLASELVVNVLVKDSRISFSKEGVTVSLVDESFGFESGDTLSFDVLESSDDRLKLLLNIQCEFNESTRIIIHSSTGKYDMSKLTTLSDSNEKAISFEFDKISNDIIISEKVVGEIQLKFNLEKYSYALEISLIVIASTLLIAVLTVFFARRRKKSGKN